MFLELFLNIAWEFLFDLIYFLFFIILIFGMIWWRRSGLEDSCLVQFFWALILVIFSFISSEIVVCTAFLWRIWLLYFNVAVWLPRKFTLALLRLLGTSGRKLLFLCFCTRFFFLWFLFWPFQCGNSGFYFSFFM